MTIICRERGYLFLQVPGTACSSIGALLMKRGDGVSIPSADITGSDGRIALSSKHATLQELFQHGALAPKEREGLFVFATVRNPFDYIASTWALSRNRYAPLLESPSSWVSLMPDSWTTSVKQAVSMDFNDWIEWQFGRMEPRRYFLNYTEGVDFIIRFEKLKDGLGEALRRIGLDGLESELPTINVTKGKEDYRSYYSSKSQAMLERVFAEDLEAFGYRFGDGENKTTISHTSRGAGKDLMTKPDISREWKGIAGVEAQ